MSNEGHEASQKVMGIKTLVAERALVPGSATPGPRPLSTSHQEPQTGQTMGGGWRAAGGWREEIQNEAQAHAQANSQSQTQKGHIGDAHVKTISVSVPNVGTLTMTRGYDGPMVYSYTLDTELQSSIVSNLPVD